MPVIMTRVWPIAMIQLPTGDLHGQRVREFTSHPLPGRRKHTPADEVVRKYDGESIGHWDRRTLVSSTRAA